VVALQHFAEFRKRLPIKLKYAFWGIRRLKACSPYAEVKAVQQEQQVRRRGVAVFFLEWCSSGIMRQAGWLTVTGLTLGLVGAVSVSTLIRKMLFGVAAWDAVTLVSVAAVLGAAAMAACFVPARRAASVDPVRALRSE
jgi:hypothetical protein